jgi:aldose 1-epimerase
MDMMSDCDMMKNIEKKFFGTLSDGRSVYSYSLKNDNGMSVKIIDFGATIVKIRTPDRKGNFTDVVLGYDNLYDYEFGDGYLGAAVGRFANRIAGGRFVLDGVTYDNLHTNNKKNHLHGGKRGFSHRMWDVEMRDSDEPSVVMTYTSIDGEEGYPGTLSVAITYTLTSDNALKINYKATTDKPTIVNLTNHSYFNLGGYASGSILEHKIWMDADTYLPTDSGLIPTGEIRAVKGTAFDFSEEKTIGKDLDLERCQDLAIAGGYDHCLNFVGGEQEEPVKRIELYDSTSGRVMEVITDQPCVQFYSGNFLTNEKYPFKGGYPQIPQTFLCLETQKMPDSVNHPQFTNVYLLPGETYKHRTTYKFSVK